MALIEKRGTRQGRVRIRKSGYPHQSRTFNKKEKAERWAKKIETEMNEMVFMSRKEAERKSLIQLLVRYTDVSSNDPKISKSTSDSIQRELDQAAI